MGSLQPCLQINNLYPYLEFQEPDWGADEGWLSGVGELWASGVADLGDEFKREMGESE